MTKDYVVVTTVRTFRHRYVMHKEDLSALNTDVTPSEKDLVDWAYDTVTMNECDEFSQEWIGEQIIDAYECDEDEMLAFFDRDNLYLSGWGRDRKIEWVRGCLKNPD